MFGDMAVLDGDEARRGLMGIEVRTIGNFDGLVV